MKLYFKRSLKRRREDGFKILKGRQKQWNKEQHIVTHKLENEVKNEKEKGNGREKR